ncbi:MAG TPA: MFS transporter [Solirubrobacterales bacterium]|nr:MFS transporter [Solirubrobacterales bacterium]
MTEAPGPQLSRWTLWFGGLAFFTCYLGQTVLGVIQPTIAADLRLSEAEAQWVVNAFFLTLALFAAPGGRLGDYYGHRQVLLVALSIFALGSLSAAVSQGFVWLVLSIAVAGMGASTLYPSSAAMIANRVSEAHRGDALGKYSAIGITVFTIGPVMAGLLTEAVSWRALFGLQVLVAAGLVALGRLRVDNRPVGEPEPFDATGLVVLMAGLAALLVSLMQALTWGWDSGATLTLFGVGLAVLAAFAGYELRRRYPLLDLGLLRKRTLRGIVLAMFAAQFIVNGYIIYIATYFQHVLGYGPLLAALAIVPSMLAEPLFNILAGRATDRIGARTPALFGYALTAVCMAWLAIFADHESYALLLPGLILLSASIAPMFTSLLTGLANAVEAGERGDANALVLTVRWIGAAAGAMVLGVVIHSGSESTPTAGPYATAFTILAFAALAGGLACALLLDKGPSR